MTTRVLHVLEALEGGTARHVVDLVRHTPDVEHLVAIPAHRSVGVTDAEAGAALSAAGADVRVIPMVRNPAHPVNATALMKLSRLCWTRRPQVLHGHSSIGGALARAVPYRAPRVYTPNGLHPGKLARGLERALGTRTDMIIAVSPSERELALRLGLVSPDRVTVIPNGIDLRAQPAPIDLHALLGLAPGTPVVGSIARLSFQKAPERFAQLCKIVNEQRPDVHFVLIGDGPEAASFDRTTSDLKGRVHRVPSLPGAAGALSSMAAFVLLSRFEGAPYAPLEAARSGVPLVLTAVVGSRDVITPDSGLLVGEHEIPVAAAGVLRILSDPDYAARLSAAMTARLAECFDVRKQGTAHAELYARLARSPR